MTFDEFHAWFTTADAALGGKPPELKLWWELKARLDAVAAEAAPAIAPAAASPLPPALNPPPEIGPRAELVDDVDDDIPSSGLTVFEEAVTLLRKGGRHSRACP